MRLLDILLHFFCLGITLYRNYSIAVCPPQGQFRSQQRRSQLWEKIFVRWLWRNVLEFWFGETSHNFEFLHLDDAKTFRYTKHPWTPWIMGFDYSCQKFVRLLPILQEKSTKKHINAYFYFFLIFGCILFQNCIVFDINFLWYLVINSNLFPGSSTMDSYRFQRRMQTRSFGNSIPRRFCWQRLSFGGWTEFERSQCYSVFLSGRYKQIAAI